MRTHCENCAKELTPGTEYVVTYVGCRTCVCRQEKFFCARACWDEYKLNLEYDFDKELRG